MADMGSFGGMDEESAEIKRLDAEVVSRIAALSLMLPRLIWACANWLLCWMQEADTDNFENWEKLVRACEALEGGLNRNSSPHALATLRDAYDRFLFKFPLLFGYWKKYADLEFNISGPESAEIVWPILPVALLVAKLTDIS